MAKGRVFQDEFSENKPNFKLLAETLIIGFLAAMEVTLVKETEESREKRKTGGYTGGYNK